MGALETASQTATNIANSVTSILPLGVMLLLMVVGAIMLVKGIWDFVREGQNEITIVWGIIFLIAAPVVKGLMTTRDIVAFANSIKPWLMFLLPVLTSLGYLGTMAFREGARIDAQVIGKAIVLGLVMFLIVWVVFLFVPSGTTTGGTTPNSPPPPVPNP